MTLVHATDPSLSNQRRRIDVCAPSDTDIDELDELEFPSQEPFEEHVSESKRHLQARTTLFLVLEEEFKDFTIGSDQFVYIDPKNPKRCLSPDVFVKIDSSIKSFKKWKVWESGAPQLAVEIVSDSDRPEIPWEEKFEQYEASGIKEIVRFDPTSRTPIRVWERIDGKLFQRVRDRWGTYECKALGLFWVVKRSDDYGLQLRLARDRKGKQLLPTPSESKVQLAQELADERRARSLAEHAKVLAEHEKMIAEEKQALAEEKQALAEQKQALAEQKQRDEAEARVRAEAERAAAIAEVEQLRARLGQARGSVT
jgi:Uma2 family endonuclease